MDEKLGIREIEIRDGEDNEIVKTSNKFLMENAIECVRSKK